MISEIVVIYTDGSLDLVWSFRPAVVTHKFPGYHWIYWVVPCLGTSLAAAFTFFSNGSNTRPYLALRYRVLPICSRFLITFYAFSQGQVE
ncbi:uncharacterized protein L203_100548 [Cryptococcus depauperatus CBS 7841]|uniref:Uncharacterized protein n=1 Tax=Cryptococcus depauperatus CBS 7841 TaxID=1295531 RepID=A0AAJ8JN70_9TREE